MLSFLVVVVAIIASVVNANAASALGPYKISDVTIAGLSAGAYMAVQMHMAYSSLINGSAIFAGGPFYCAQANLMTAEYKCMKTYEGLPDVDKLISLTASYASSGLIDKPANLKDDRIYLYSGEDDSVVDPKVMHSLQTYYMTYVQPENVVADFAVQSEHCWPTLSFGENCNTLSSPYIGKCNFDGSGVAVKTLYPTIKTRGTAVKANLKSFSQKGFFTDTKACIDDTGYIYVPTACANGGSCHLLVALHGCLQGQDTIGNSFAANIGLNEWAESNNIVVLYPYVKKSYSAPSNPNGCWDWWGYTDKNYANQKGVQMKFVRALIDEVRGIKH